MPLPSPLPRQRARRKSQPAQKIGTICLIASENRIVDRSVIADLADTLKQFSDRLLVMARSGSAWQVAQRLHSIGGQAIGFSTASSLKEHTQKFHFPDDGVSWLVFAGQDYETAQHMMLSSADVIIVIPGESADVHTLASITTAVAPVGMLLPPKHSSQDIGQLINLLPDASKVLFDSQPSALFSRLVSISPNR